MGVSSRRLHRAMQNAGYATPAELASASHLSVLTVELYLNENDHIISPTVLCKISSALEIKPSALLVQKHMKVNKTAVKTAMRNAGITKADQLAAAAHVSREKALCFGRGIGRYSPGTFCKFGQALGVKPSSLVKDSHIAQWIDEL